MPDARYGTDVEPRAGRAERPAASGNASESPDTVSRPSPVLRCRPIGDADLDAVVRLLRRAFPVRTDLYWRRGLARHVARRLPPDLPRFGFLLEADGEPVGVLLTLHTVRPHPGGRHIRCNLSSWYVDPRFRPQAALLDRMAAKDPQIAYLNVTPHPRTWPMLEANGFTRHGRGQILAVPALARPRAGVSVREVAADDPMDGLDEPDREMLRDHIGYGCRAFVVSDGASRSPLLLQARRIGLGGLVPGVRIPCLHVVYCRSVEDLARAAAPLGRLMMRRHRTPFLLVDAAGPVAGLCGRFVAGKGVRYSRGPVPVAPGDLAYTEIVLFGP